MHLIIILAEQPSLKIDIHDQSSVMNLKQAITSETHIPVDDQSLAVNGHILDNNGYLKDFGLKDSSEVLLLTPLKTSTLIQINILLPRDIHLVLQVSETATVNDLKRLIVQKTGDMYIPIELIYNHWVLDEGRHLHEYKIVTESHIMLASHLPVAQRKSAELIFQNSGLSLPISVYFISSVADPITLKCDRTALFVNIRAELEEKMGHVAKHLIFSYNGKNIDDNSSLSEIGITDGASVFMAQKEQIDPKNTMVVNVGFDDGSSIQFKEIPLTCTTYDLIKRIENKKSVKANQIAIFYKSRSLVNDATLVSYGFSDGDTVKAIRTDLRRKKTLSGLSKISVKHS